MEEIVERYDWLEMESEHTEVTGSGDSEPYVGIVGPGSGVSG